jgi:UDPglucose 6-dehydrogenase
MDISIIGSGYVGTTLAACLADLGHDVVAVDIDQAVVDRLNASEAPIHEPGLQPLLDAHVGSRLRATTDYAAVTETDLTFLTVQTPACEDGSIDVNAVEAAARDVGEAIAEKEGYHLVVVKSTVIPGMTEERFEPAIAEASGKTPGKEISVGVNPEFQSQGSAVEDFMEPDKIVLGTDGDERTLDLLAKLYEPIVVQWDVPVVETGRREAAMIKYANNVFLASKISLINELGNICKEYEVDSYEVADAIGLDDRIGERFLRSGVGWGGSCFGKDTAALMAAARQNGYEPELLEAVVGVNDKQPRRMISLLECHVDPADERIAVLGVAFKPGTDDTRGTRARPVVAGLLKRDAGVVVYDPTTAAESLAAEFPERVTVAESAEAALKGAHGALIVTDWPVFADLDEEFDAMASPVVVDGRRVIKRREGLVYEGLTW